MGKKKKHLGLLKISNYFAADNKTLCIFSDVHPNIQLTRDCIYPSNSNWLRHNKSNAKSIKMRSKITNMMHKNYHKKIRNAYIS